MTKIVVLSKRLVCACAIVCASADVSGVQSVASPSVIERTLTIAADRPIAIEATVADIRITGSTRTDVNIVVTIPTASDASAVDVSIDDSPSALRIRAIQLNGQINRRIRASILVNVPANSVLETVRIVDGKIVLEGLTGHVSASSRQGEIEGSRLAGVVRLETGFGDVTIRDSELVPDGLLRLRAFNGDVHLQLRRQPTDARVLALTFNGQIASDIPLTMKTSFGPRSGSASVGLGEPVIAIDVLKGNIGITVNR